MRVTAAQNAAVRRATESTGESLSEYVVRHAVRAAHGDLADRALGDVERLRDLLDRARATPLSDAPTVSAERAVELLPDEFPEPADG